MKKSWDFVDKNVARDKALTCSSKKPKETVLFFPSHSCNDLTEALKIGLINKKTFIIAIERDKSAVDSIKAFLKKNGLKNFYIHEGEVYKLELDKVLDGNKIDYMFFDICGNLTANIADWFYRNQHNFGLSELPMTFSITPRGKRATLKSDTTSFMRSVEKIIREKDDHSQACINNNNILDFMHKCNSDNLLRDVSMICKVLYYCFSNREINISEIFLYRENREDKIIGRGGTNMGLFNISIIGDKPEDITFSSIVQLYDKKVGVQNRLRKYDVDKKKKKNKKTKKIKLKKTKKKKKIKQNPMRNAYDIARVGNIFGRYTHLTNMPQGERSWISIRAKKIGLDPKDVMAKIQKKLYVYGLDAK